MTTSQIKSLGILMDQWITLEYLVNYIGFGSDSGIFVSPVYTQFYFESSSENLFIRKTKGARRERNNNTVDVEHDGEIYFLQLAEGGINDSKIGRYHDVVGFDEICLINSRQ